MRITKPPALVDALNNEWRRTSASECVVDKCTDVNDDCCAPPQLQEAATCKPGYTAKRLHSECFGFADATFCCLAPRAAQPTPREGLAGVGVTVHVLDGKGIFEWGFEETDDHLPPAGALLWASLGQPDANLKYGDRASASLLSAAAPVMYEPLNVQVRPSVWASRRAQTHIL